MLLSGTVATERGRRRIKYGVWELEASLAHTEFDRMKKLTDPILSCIANKKELGRIIKLFSSF